MTKVPVVPPLSKQDIEKDADRLLAKFDPDGRQGKHPVDIELLFECDLPRIIPGLDTGYDDLSQLGGVLGFTDAGRKISRVDLALYRSTNPATVRRCRATVAHEVAHCFHHIKCMRSFMSLSAGKELMFRAQKNVPAYLDPEWQAWTMAGALLMPKAVIMKMVADGYNVQHMAEHFNVNPSFVRSRLGKLK